jgi:dienelactone hydrolase
MSLARFPIVASTIQQGRTLEFWGDDRELFPLEQFEDGKVPASLPPVWLLHGRQDSAVPVEGTFKFIDVLKPHLENKLHVSIEDGDHGFDNHAPDTGEAATLQTGWVQEGVKFVEQHWPRVTAERQP